MIQDRSDGLSDQTDYVIVKEVREIFGRDIC